MHSTSNTYAIITGCLRALEVPELKEEDMPMVLIILYPMALTCHRIIE